ncbi:MAG: Asp-tRNA(Asn)/Glu-tRNA(Gln) amidotransferase subunit GatC [Candidatus Kerfeldbacteria bacterium]|nr:Asp-tRNA(Asn)/Glu-tRNA(Gln) amidotransferase subunit GatC [Candidatus Kerfeldbacteria bacterium]
MKLNRLQVTHIAQLSKMALSAQEIDTMEEELNAILHLVDTLNAVSTEGVEPMSQVTGITNVLRTDEDRYTFERSDMLQTMPAVDQDGFLKVHAVFTGDSPSH